MTDEQKIAELNELILGKRPSLSFSLYDGVKWLLSEREKYMQVAESNSHVSDDANTADDVQHWFRLAVNTGVKLRKAERQIATMREALEVALDFTKNHVATGEAWFAERDSTRIVIEDALAATAPQPERAKVGDVVQSTADARIQFTVGYSGGDCVWQSPTKALGTWVLPHGEYEIVRRAEDDILVSRNWHELSVRVAEAARFYIIYRGSSQEQDYVEALIEAVHEWEADGDESTD